MKTLRKNRILIVQILFFLIVSQSCQVYYKTTASVNEAAKTPEDQWIKAKMKNGQVYHFKSIYAQNDHLFGRSSKKSNYVLFATTETLESLRLQNKKMSHVGNTFIVLGLISVGILLWYQHEMKDFDCCGSIMTL